MPVGSLLLAAAVIILVGLFLARPLILSPNNKQSRISARQELRNQKETILAQIEILDFDYETGTLPEQQYKQRRRQMILQAAEILKALDEYADVQSTDTLDEEIETAVAHLRKKPIPTQPKTIPQTQKTAQPIQTNGQIKFCAQCGQSVDLGDKFCAHCGHKLLHP